MAVARPALLAPIRAIPLEAWRKARRRCPGTRLRVHCSRLSLFCCGKPLGGMGLARSIPPLFFSPGPNRCHSRSQRIRSCDMSPTYYGCGASRCDQNRARELPVANGTGSPQRKCPASLTFLTPHPLTMNQAWPLTRPALLSGSI